MATATVFLNNRSQAVRLPKSVAFPPGITRVTVEVIGDTRVLTPAATTFSEWAATWHPSDPEFMADRAQGTFDDRDWQD